MAISTAGWSKLPISLSELCISMVLRCGQSFRWKQNDDGIWSCSLKGRILALKQDSEALHYHAIFPSSKPEHPIATVDLIHDYFNLSTDLTAAYARWSSRDPHFAKLGSSFSGVRILRQDPWENLLSFICSSNNNISRISQMVENLCVHFGPKLGEFDGKDYFDFPTPKALAVKGVEEKLRKLGFGYRAKYIAQTAVIVNQKPEGWLEGLREKPYREAHEALLELSGVGPKVADCICLMSLDKKEAVPVDTHVWQIAQRDYKFKLKGKTLNKAVYDAIGDHFRELWGDDAGWAHSVLFTADLKAFADVKKGVKVEVKEEVKSEIKVEEEEEEGRESGEEKKKVKRSRKTTKTTVVKTEEVVVVNGVKRAAKNEPEDDTGLVLRKRLRSGRER